VSQLHVYPHTDDKVHIVDPTLYCWCKPLIQDECTPGRKAYTMIHHPLRTMTPAQRGTLGTVIKEVEDPSGKVKQRLFQIAGGKETHGLTITKVLFPDANQLPAKEVVTPGRQM